MQNVFLVFGYGVPKDITKDENLSMYLKLVFNKIYASMIKSAIPADPIIIFSGGKTDLYQPYQRTEADEMIRFFKILYKRSFVKKLTRNWHIIAERKALSTLENFLYCKEILTRRKIHPGKIYIFCEQTRGQRIKTLSKKIFSGSKAKIIPIDFDTSEHRYLDPNFLKQKEKAEVRHSLWALQTSEHLKKHHAIFKEKIELLKKVKPELRQKALKAWWEKKLKEFI